MNSNREHVWLGSGAGPRGSNTELALPLRNFGAGAAGSALIEERNQPQEDPTPSAASGPYPPRLPGRLRFSSGGHQFRLLGLPSGAVQHWFDGAS